MSVFSLCYDSGAVDYAFLVVALYSSTSESLFKWSSSWSLASSVLMRLKPLVRLNSVPRLNRRLRFFRNIMVVMNANLPVKVMGK